MIGDLGVCRTLVIKARIQLCEDIFDQLHNSEAGQICTAQAESQTDQPKSDRLLDFYDPICGELCGAVSCIVVWVDYRLAPEHHFSAAVNDAGVIDHCQEIGGNSDRIAIGVDTAGGNLAAVTAIEARPSSG